MNSNPEIINPFPGISLQELDRVKLLDREDTKFIFNQRQLAELLDRTSGAFSVLEIDNFRLFDYDTRYFDTPDLQLYLQHHNGLRPRYKIRYRRYRQLNSTFFEIKRKNNRNRTVKNRISVPELRKELGPAETKLLADSISGTIGDLQASLEVRFTRMTLVNRDETDRITIDTAIEVSGFGKIRSFPELVIAEIKQPRYRPSAIFMQTMHQLRIPEMRLSKYCLGLLSIKSTVKYNRLKPKMRQLEQIQSESNIMEPTHA